MLRRGHCVSQNLLRAEREAVERRYRSATGGIHALVATTTLAAGINTPASTVVLAENEFVGEDGRQFTVAEYKNMAGRAGRLGSNEIGKAIILAETPMERAQLFQRYVLGVPEDVKSSFQQRDLPTWTLRLLSQVRGVRAEEIPGLLVNSTSITDPAISAEAPGIVAAVLSGRITATPERAASLSVWYVATLSSHARRTARNVRSPRYRRLLACFIYRNATSQLSRSFRHPPSRLTRA